MILTAFCIFLHAFHVFYRELMTPIQDSGCRCCRLTTCKLLNEWDLLAKRERSSKLWDVWVVLSGRYCSPVDKDKRRLLLQLKREILQARAKWSTTQTAGLAKCWYKCMPGLNGSWRLFRAQKLGSGGRHWAFPCFSDFSVLVLCKCSLTFSVFRSIQP